MRLLYAALAVLLAAAAPVPAQYSGVASNSDGTQVLAATTYRQTGTDQPADPKLFRIFGGQASLQITQSCNLLTMTGACGIEDLQASGDGAVIYESRIACDGGSSCIIRETTRATLLRGEEVRTFGGRIRISRNGRWLVHHDQSGVPGDSARISRLIDLQTGEIAELGTNLRRSGRALRVADDGTVLMSEGWLHRPGSRVQIPLPAADVLVTDMDALATTVLAEKKLDSLYAIDAGSGRTLRIGPAGRASYGGTISADGKWVLYVSVVGGTPQLFYSSLDGQLWRQLTSSTDGVERATLSDDGQSALALTRSGALLRIRTSNGALDEIAGPLP